MHLKNGGVASNTVVSSGITLVVSSGGTADPTVISNGGSETISSGGTDLGALISGGTQFVYRLTSVAIRETVINRVLAVRRAQDQPSTVFEVRDLVATYQRHDA